MCEMFEGFHEQQGNANMLGKLFEFKESFVIIVVSYMFPMRGALHLNNGWRNTDSEVVSYYGNQSPLRFPFSSG